jgi:hypothetical protein
VPEPNYAIELTPPDIEPYRAGNTGIDYVTTLDSGSAGPHVLVTAVTHGNEICGAIALDRLFRAGLRPRQGKLTLAFDNVAAYRSFDRRAAPVLSTRISTDCGRPRHSTASANRASSPAPALCVPSSTPPISSSTSTPCNMPPLR